MGLVPELIADLGTMPDDVARLIRQIPSGRLRWKPGEPTLRGLLHYLRSHDQQHLACLHWLLGKMG